MEEGQGGSKDKPHHRSSSSTGSVRGRFDSLSKRKDSRHEPVGLLFRHAMFIVGGVFLQISSEAFTPVAPASSKTAELLGQSGSEDSAHAPAETDGKAQDAIVEMSVLPAAQPASTSDQPAENVPAPPPPPVATTPRADEPLQEPQSASSVQSEHELP